MAFPSRISNGRGAAKKRRKALRLGQPQRRRLFFEQLEDRRLLAVDAQLIKDINIEVNSAGSNPANLVDVNGTLFFAAATRTTGYELWKSDGTAAGTVLVKDIRSGFVGSDSRYLTNVNGTLFFVATTETEGRELWAVVDEGTLLPTLVGDNLVIADTDAVGKNNQFTVSVSGTNIVISDANEQFAAAPAGGTLSNGNKTLTIPLSVVTGTITFNAGGGNDTLTVNQSTLIPRVINYNGGSQTSTNPGDQLVLTGGSFTTVEHIFTNANDGSIKLNGATAINYTGLEPISDNMSAVDRIFTYNGGSETITVTTGATLHNKIVSTLGESVEFNNPTGSLTINAGTGGDTVTISSVHSGFNAALTINGDAGNDTVNLNADITFASGKNLIVNAETVNTGANADLVTSGAGTITITADTIQIGDGNSGAITVSAAITHPSNSNFVLTSGGNIVFNPGSLSTGGGTLRLTPGPTRCCSAGPRIPSGSSRLAPSCGWSPGWSAAWSAFARKRSPMIRGKLRPAPSTFGGAARKTGR
jgi:ELWxxDGT repeat protein